MPGSPARQPRWGGVPSRGRANPRRGISGSSRRQGGVPAPVKMSGEPMQRAAIVLAVTAAVLTAVAQAFRPAVAAVTVTPNESSRRVDIAIGGAPFTPYI